MRIFWRKVESGGADRLLGISAEKAHPPTKDVLYCFSFSLIQLYKLPRVAHSIEIAQKLLARDDHCASAIVGVEA